jgi:dihydroneopterin aldolase
VNWKGNRDCIVVTGIKAEGKHGLDADGERDKPQPFEAEAEVYVDLKPVANADRLDETIDYLTIAKTVRSVIEERSFELLETLADAIATEVLALGADSVRIRVRKPRAAEHAGVEDISIVVERST